MSARTTRRRPLSRWLARLDAHTLWAFNTQLELSPRRTARRIGDHST